MEVEASHAKLTHVPLPFSQTFGLNTTFCHCIVASCAMEWLSCSASNLRTQVRFALRLCMCDAVCRNWEGDAQRYLFLLQNLASQSVADPENFGGGDNKNFKHKTSQSSEIQRFFPPKIRWSPKKKKKEKSSSPKLRLIFRPKLEIQTFFPPKIRWSPKK